MDINDAELVLYIYIKNYTCVCVCVCVFVCVCVCMVKSSCLKGFYTLLKFENY